MNFKEAIIVHGRWKTTLSNYIKTADGSLDPAIICLDNKCALGLWIYGEGGQKIGQSAEYDELRTVHSQMHLEASKVVSEINSKSGKSEEELIGAKSGFLQASTKMIALLQGFDQKFGAIEVIETFPTELQNEPKEDLAKIVFQLEKMLFSLRYNFNFSPNERGQIPYISKVTQAVEEAILQSKMATRRLLDNAGDGFISIKKDGTLGSEYSAMAEEILLYQPSGKKFSYLFAEKAKDIDEAIDLLFSGALDFESVTPLLPQTHFINLRHVDFTYKPIRNSLGELIEVLVIMRDVTRIRNMEKQAEKDAKINKSLLTILASTNDFLSVLEELGELDKYRNSRVDALRSIHTLKGGFGLFGIEELMDACHNWETTLKGDESPKRLHEAIDSLKKSTDSFLQKYSHILNIKGNVEKTFPVSVPRLRDFLRSFESFVQKKNVSADVALLINNLFSIPMKDALAYLNKVAETTSQKLGKPVELIWTGEALVNPLGYEPLFLSFVHLVRNAIDHGIENPELRMERSKPEIGRIEINCSDTGKGFLIRVQDDGGGINIAKLREKAQKNNPGKTFTDLEIANSIFEAGVSSKDEITSMSGRGVGLDAVRTEAKKLGGDAKVISFTEQGTCIEIQFNKSN